MVSKTERTWSAIGIIVVGFALWGALVLTPRLHPVAAQEPESPPVVERSGLHQDTVAAMIYAELIANRRLPMGQQPLQHQQRLAAEAYAAADVFLAVRAARQRQDD